MSVSWRGWSKSPGLSEQESCGIYLLLLELGGHESALRRGIGIRKPFCISTTTDCVSQHPVSP